jgi:peptidoglycan/LPS O-acetylase OafA/YrhL
VSSALEPPAAPQKLRWLNSLRALGVVLVLIYHAFPALLPGGFIGVDIFFVVSGYLICALLIREQESTGSIRLIAFYVRRLRRLFPAMLVMVLFGLTISLLVSPDFRVDCLRQGAAALSWSTNSYEILSGGSYEAQLLPHLFIHTWTLAIEMRYYLVWALVVVVVCRLCGRRRRGYLPLIFALAIAALLSSYLYMNTLVSAGADPSAAYMGTLSHAFPLMCGSAAACLCGFAPGPRFRSLARVPAFKPASLVLASLSVGGLVALSLCLDFDSMATYRFGILLSALLTALLILLGALWQTLSGRDEPRLTNYIGLLSYSIYLFHWPLIMVARALVQQLGVSRDLASIVGGTVAIPLTFICAALCYRFVEDRFRVHRGALPSARPTRRARPAPSAVRITQDLVTIALMLCLGGGAVVAAVSAPLYSSIEARLDSGKMTLDVSALPAPGAAATSLPMAQGGNR